VSAPVETGGPQAVPRAADGSGRSTAIATIPKSKTEEVRVGLEYYRGHRLVDIRIFAEFTPARVRMPTKKGVSLSITALPDLIEALRDAQAAARSMGILGNACPGRQ
jgi:hypothetical protein